MTRQQLPGPKISSMRTLASVAIAVALGLALQWIIAKPSASIEQVQEQIEEARSRPAPLLQPLPQSRTIEQRAWTITRDPFADAATAAAPAD